MLKGGINIIKDIDTTQREVIFAYSKFDYDSDNDLTVPTAFDKTVKESGVEGSNRIRHVWNHDRKDLPIGAIKEMWRDNEYAYVRSKVLENEKGKDVWEAYKENAINEHSYWGKSFNHGVNDRGGKLIKEVKLFEVSTVLWGAQENAKLLEMIKSGVNPDNYMIDYLNDLLKYVKKSSASDDFLETLELEILKGKDIIESLDKSSRIDDTLDIVEPKIELSLADIYRLKRNI